MNISYNEFHISREVRDACNFDESMYSSSGNVIFSDLKAVRNFQMKLNKLFEDRGQSEKKVSAGNLNAMGLIDEIFHYVCMLFRKNKAPLAFTNILADLDTYFGKEEIDDLLLEFMEEFPPVAVYQHKLSSRDYLFQTCVDAGTGMKRDNREQVLEEMILLHLANENPAFHQFAILFDDKKLALNPSYIRTWNQIKAYFQTLPVFGPKNNDLITMLKEPVVASPTSLKGQLDYIRTMWGDILGEWLKRLLAGIDTITEEEKAAWHPMGGNGPDMAPYSYDSLMKEYERFSPDRDWMPKVVLMAKTVLVWLFQLSKKYKREITRLDQIPDEELDDLRDQGFTGLWLIGLWERSNASRRIKQINGNPEAAASAYSLLDYQIASNLGGWDALENLRKRCWIRGIRLASDMVPNHTGMDGDWVVNHPDYFITTKDCPFPNYTFNGENLSHDPRVAVYLEDHYYSKTDCAVCFKRVDTYTGDVTYIYHGNDGTGMPWNDTAQIDFLNPTAREAVMQQILKVAQNFPIIRFDAAMVLAKKHIRRLWYPEPGHGGDIASRSQYAISSQEFEQRIPNEFWREVVDRCAREMPDTLLLAEAFWMMEGYFTRTLGMHRVYNSAFMNMLKKEENQKYRDTVKNTIKFDPQILKRFVNFMNNPDEETAVAQFGKGDKYFGVCTLMVTMPGLPMFGHGQIQGYEEKYGMEYTKAYRDETPDENLLNRHRHDIFPLLHKRYLFAQIENFLFYDVWNNNVVNENIFAYSNGTATEKSIVFYNNKYESAAGWIKQSCPYAVKTGSGEKDVISVTQTIGQGLGLTPGDDHYCILREHVSGLWYIRKSDDIINNGMFVSLRGFEYQVYLDIQQVVDTAEGKYRILNDILKGSGVKDIEVAWEEYRYRELYSALTSFLSPSFYNSIKTIFTPAPVLKAQGKETIDLQDFYNSIKKEALAYYEAEIREQTAALKADGKEDKTVKSAEQRFSAFCKEIDYLAGTVMSAQGLDVTKAVPKSRKHTAFKMTFDNIIYEGLVADADAVKILTSYAAVSTVDGELCRKWGYSRKLSELINLEEEQVTGNQITCDARDILNRIFIVSRIQNYNFGTSGQVKSTYDVAKLLVDSEYAYTLTGAHEYDNIRWFNKEKMDSTLWYSFAAVAMSSPRILREQIYRLYRTLTAAKDGAEYHCDSFTSVLKPQKKSLRKKDKASQEEIPGIISAPKAERKSTARGTKTTRSKKQKD